MRSDFVDLAEGAGRCLDILLLYQALFALY